METCKTHVGWTWVFQTAVTSAKVIEALTFTLPVAGGGGGCDLSQAVDFGKPGLCLHNFRAQQRVGFPGQLASVSVFLCFPEKHTAAKGEIVGFSPAA